MRLSSTRLQTRAMRAHARAMASMPRRINASASRAMESVTERASRKRQLRPSRALHGARVAPRSHKARALHARRPYGNVTRDSVVKAGRHHTGRPASRGRESRDTTMPLQPVCQGEPTPTLGLARADSAIPHGRCHTMPHRSVPLCHIARNPSDFAGLRGARMAQAKLWRNCRSARPCNLAR